MQWDERLGRRLRLKDLHTLQVIVEVGSMAKAAQRLAASQPAISKAMADLEHTLGVPLLDRTPRGVEVTAYGRALLRHGAAVFDDLRQGIAEIEFLRDPSRGELRVGAPEPATPVLSAIINAVAAERPKIRFDVMVGDTALLIQALRDRRLDIVLTRMIVPKAEQDLEAEVLFNDPLVVIASARNPLLKRRTIRLSDLITEWWVLPPQETVLGRFGAAIFEERGLEPPQAAVVTPSLQMRLSLVSSGRFLTLLPQAMLRFPSAWGGIARVKLDLSDTERPVGLLTLRGRNMSPVLATFVEAARQVASRIGLGSEAILEPRGERGR